MDVSRNVFSFINVLPDAVLIIDRKRGKLIGANTVFFKLTGLADNAFLGTRVLDLPFSSKKIKRGLFRLFINLSRDAGYNKTYLFAHVCPDGTIKNVSASAHMFVIDGQECVVFNFKLIQPEVAPFNFVDSWNYYLALAYEPYLEFRVTTPVYIIDNQEDRLEFLRMLGETLRVKFSNNAAVKLYGDNGGTLEGKTFLSLFNKEEDAIGFLDILSVVGHIKAETNVNTNKAMAVRVEMDCEVKFDKDDNITALCCSQRDLSGHERYKATIEGYKFEMDLMLNQPFVGFAFLYPPSPLERPPVEDLDATLDDMLNQITVARANETMIDIYDSDKSKFLKKPMLELFDDADVARQVLKELFVMRETSLGKFKASEGEDDFELVLILRATFNKADQLSGVLVIASKHSYGYRPRHAPSNVEE